MATTHRASRGFTLVELAVTVAIIGVVSALAFSSFSRQRPRAELLRTSTELQSLIHGARQTALATGHHVSILVFPDFATSASKGRIIVYDDGNYDFYVDGRPANFKDFKVDAPAAGDRSQILETYDIPAGLAIDSVAAVSLVAPWPTDALGRCSFCATDGDHRGAIEFDEHGRAAFHSTNGVPLATQVGGLSLVASATGGQRTIAVAAATGATIGVQPN